jgi:hypothetical protein
VPDCILTLFLVKQNVAQMRKYFWIGSILPRALLSVAKTRKTTSSSGVIRCVLPQLAVESRGKTKLFAKSQRLVRGFSGLDSQKPGKLQKESTAWEDFAANSVRAASTARQD